MLDDDEPPRRPPSFYGWTPERELLVALTESVQRQHAWLIGVHSKDHKVPKVRPIPRPITALDRVRERQQQASVAAVIALFRPKDE